MTNVVTSLAEEMVRHGRYTIVRKLAEGGMAEIFLAKQHGPGGFEKPVVLKRIHSAFYADRQFRNMLMDEAHISMGLSHNNVVQILDLGLAGGRYFLVLELIDGWDLSRIIARASAAKLPMPVGIALYIVGEVCRALSYAHGKRSIEGRPLGIVHRDVSPQNVLISDQGEIKLADFGVAKARTNRESTGHGVVKGKLGFMSPEQASGEPLDSRSDLYSTGSILYLLVTGHKPFEAPTDYEILLRVQRGEFPPPENFNSALSAPVCNLIQRAMTFAPEHRYQTADELLVDLEDILRAEFDMPGETALKLWLTDLARRDGEPPISRSALVPAPGSGSSSEPLEGDELELGEAEDRSIAAELDLRGYDEQRLEVTGKLRVTGARDVRMNAARDIGSEATVAMKMESRATAAVAHATSDMARRTRSQSGEFGRMSELLLPPLSDDLPPPHRMDRRSHPGALVIVLGMLIIGGAAAVAWRWYGVSAANVTRETPTASAAALAAPPDARVAGTVEEATARAERLARARRLSASRTDDRQPESGRAHAGEGAPSGSDPSVNIGP